MERYENKFFPPGIAEKITNIKMVVAKGLPKEAWIDPPERKRGWPYRAHLVRRTLSDSTVPDSTIKMKEGLGE